MKTRVYPWKRLMPVGLGAAALACLLVSLYAATNKRVLREGIAIIKFNKPELPLVPKHRRSNTFRDINVPHPGLPSLDPQDIDIPIPVVPNSNEIQSKVLSAIDSAQTATSNMIDEVQNTAGNIIDKAKNLTNIALPRNITIGTQSYCVNLDNDTTCRDLPLDLSSLLPADTLHVLESVMPGFSSLAEKLNRFTVPIFLYILIAGIMCSFSLWLACIVFTFQRTLICVPGLDSKKVRGGVTLLFSLLCLMIFAVILGFLSKLGSISDLLPSWIDLRYGSLKGLSIGALIPAIFTVMTSTAILRWG